MGRRSKSSRHSCITALSRLDDLEDTEEEAEEEGSRDDEESDEGATFRFSLLRDFDASLLFASEELLALSELVLRLRNLGIVSLGDTAHPALVLLDT